MSVNVTTTVNEVAVNDVNKTVIVTEDKPTTAVEITQSDIVLVTDTQEAKVNVTQPITDIVVLSSNKANVVDIYQPISDVVNVIAQGPQGPAGPQGPQGPVGSIFPYTGSAGISGSLIVTGSVRATSFTGSLLGTASYALNANINTSNFATLGSNTFGGAQTINSDLKVSDGSRIYVDGGNSIPSPGISSYSDPITQLNDQGQYSGETIKGVAGETLELGQLIFLYTDGSWYKAVASGSQAAATSLLGILVGSMPATPTENITVLLRGNTYTDKLLGSEAPGIPIWISTTAGSMRDSAPSTQGQFIRQVGHILATHVLRFNPDNYYSIVP